MSHLSEEERIILRRDLEGRICALQGAMNCLVYSGQEEGTVSTSLRGWNFSREVLKSTQLVHQHARGFKVKGSEESWTHSIEAPENVKTCPAALALYMQEWQQHTNALVDELAEIPKLISYDDSIIRWPMELTLGFSNHGLNMCLLLTSCHIRENHKNYRLHSV